MKEKIVKILTIIFIIIFILFAGKWVKEKRFERLVISRLKRLKGKEYKIVDRGRKFVRGVDEKKDNCDLKNNYKLVYEMNFECSVCLVKLVEIHNLYKELSKIGDIKLIVVSKESSGSYMRYFFDKELKEYDLCVVNQDSLYDGVDLYLLDKSNRVIMAGDIFRYPFLEKVYIKEFKKRLALKDTTQINE